MLSEGLPFQSAHDHTDVRSDATERILEMSRITERDVEKACPLPEFVAKLRRLADALETGERFEIQIAGERISVPVRAVYTIEHEREGDAQEIEFQISWSNK